MVDACRLYLVTPPAFEPAAFARLLAEALDGGDVGAVQLRLKHAGDDEILRMIDLLRPIVQSRDVAFILNDRPDLAVQSGCDGAHIGAEDMDVTRARTLLGDLQLGVSCYDSRDAAMVAGEAGADYVAYGAFFPSSTKDTAIRADPDLLRWWSEMMELPVVAIGGITADNCGPLVAAGADFLAVVSAVWSYADGPAAGVKAMNAAIARG
ncbi:thiamine phosphate synthase [Lichenicola cladoniae]|uniref:Thiamine-phosphate synthase n=1 Tax=Lichenicola cladoniae TaxID=1484109 RepID=A0A6M8HP16_9PROT|nr:thiamine phosphate synthase [Lichenicola cladoniae]NPD68453.1 thiamine phosphate synthase [Acetobacteraceae bacterium]QKE90066.1 thiamine phosphate synthase [Lichenicola cladoniae]